MKADSLITLLLFGGAAYLIYQIMQSGTAAQQVTTVGTSLNPITVPGAPAPVLVASGPLTSAPQGPVDPGTGMTGYSEAARFFDSRGMW